MDHFCDEVTKSTARAYRLKVALILTYYHIDMIITSCCPLKIIKESIDSRPLLLHEDLILQKRSLIAKVL